MAIAERVGASPGNEQTLAVAVVVALVLHGFLLVLIGLDLAYSPPRPAPALRVALTPRTAPVPESSVVSPPLPEQPAAPAAQAPAEPQPVEEYVPDPPEPKPEPVQTPQVVDTRAAAPEQTEAEPPPPAPAPVPAPAPALTGSEIQSMGLALARAGLPEPPSNPREKRLDMRAMTTMEEFYIQAWVDKVQRVGENNFPPAAMGRGEVHCPVLDIVLKADGSIDKLKVTESCGDPALDNAALDIVLMAAPFAPFPAELERNYDTLRFSRRWMFDDGRVRTGG